MSASTSAPFPALWEEAARKYEEIAGKPLEGLDLRTLQSTEDLEKAVQNQAQEFKEFRAKKKRLYMFLRKAMQPIEALGSTAAHGSTSAFPPCALVFGAVMLMIRAAKDLSKVYDEIEDLLEDLCVFTARIGVYSHEATTSVLQQQLSKQLTALLEVLAFATKAIHRKRLISFGRNIVIGEDRGVSDARKKLDKLTRREQGIAIAEVLTVGRQNSRRLDEGFERLESKINDLSVSMSDSHVPSQEDKKQRYRHRIWAILSPSDASDVIFYRNIRKRLPGSCEWVLEERDFKSWLDKTNPLLWFTGISGAGKSFLCSYILNFLKDLYPQGIEGSSQVSIGYHFFKENDTHTRSFGQALRNIAFQFYNNDPVYAKYLDDHLQSEKDVDTMEKAWVKLFFKFYIANTTSQSSAYIVLDGLDETDLSNREEILVLVQDVKQQQGGRSRIQLILSGQPHVISNAIKMDALGVVVDQSKTAGDITRYAQDAVQKTRQLRRSSESIQNLIYDTIREKSSGMFLWADLMIQQLNTKRRPSDIEKALKEAPKGLGEMLKASLRRFALGLNPEEVGQLNIILCWVLSAKRPLTLAEFDAILRYMSPEGESDLDLEGLLRSRYGLVLTVEREDGLSTAELPTDTDSDPSSTTVIFSHDYFGDFFGHQDEDKGPSDSAPTIGFGPSAASKHTLLHVLRIVADTEYDDLISKTNGLREYAEEFWLQHLRDTKLSDLTGDEKKQLGPLLVKICRDEVVIERWMLYTTWRFWYGQGVSILRHWLEDEELLNSLPETDREWVKSTSQQPNHTLNQNPLLAARHWLVHGYWNWTSCFETIFAYLQSIKGTPIDALWIGNAEILETAEWSGFDHTATWHDGVAEVLKSYSLLDDALLHAEMALERNPKQWNARSLSAWVSAVRGDYGQAIELHDENIQMMLQEAKSQNYSLHKITKHENALFKFVLNRTLGEMGDCLWHLDRLDEAQDQYHRACTIAPVPNTWSSDSFRKCLECLHLQERHSEIYERMKEFQRLGAEDDPRNFLVQHIASLQNTPSHSFFACARIAMQKLGKLQYLVDVFNEVIHTHRSATITKKTTVLELFVTDLYYFNFGKVADAVQIWERISRKETRKADYSSLWAKNESKRRLAQYHFDQARMTRDTPKCAQHVENLERLGKSTIKFDNSVNGSLPGLMTISAASLMLGHWYHLEERIVESRACFKPYIRCALEMLSNDDLENDDEAYGYLLRIALCMGDDVGAAGLCRTYSARKSEFPQHNPSSNTITDSEDNAIIPDGNQGGSPPSPTNARSSSSEEKQGPQKATSTNKGKPPSYTFECDGDCTRQGLRSISPTETIWRCRYCFDVDFCEDCFPLAQEGKLSRSICSPQHDWVRIELTDREIPFQKVFVGNSDELMDLDDVIKELKTTWDL